MKYKLLLLFVFVSFGQEMIYERADAQSWQMISPMLTVRDGFQAVVLHDHRILVIGGYNGTSALSECEIYDPKSDKWSVTGSLNIPRLSFQAQTLQDGRVLVAGGLTDLGLSTSNSCELYDPSTGNWKMTASMSDRRELFASLLLPDGTVLLSGGLDAQSYGYLNSIDEFDPKTETIRTLPKMRIGLYAQTMFFSPQGNGVIVCGGQFFGWDGYFLRSNEMFRFTDSTWVVLDSLVTPQSDGGEDVQLADGRYYLLSGRSGSTFATDTVEMFDPHTLHWQQQPPLGRVHWNGKTFNWDGDTLLIAGGIDDPHVYQDQLSYCTFYDVRTGSSWDGPELNVPRSSPGVQIEDLSTDSCSRTITLYMLGGAGRNSTLLASCEKLSLDPRPNPSEVSIASPFYSFDKVPSCAQMSGTTSVENAGCIDITLDSIRTSDSSVRFYPPTVPLAVAHSNSVIIPFKYAGLPDSGYTNASFYFTTATGSEIRFMHFVHPRSKYLDGFLFSNPAPIAHGYLNQTVRYPLPVALQNTINSDSLLRLTSSFQFQLTFDASELQVNSVTPPQGWILRSESISGDTLSAAFTKANTSVHVLDSLGSIQFNVIDVQNHHSSLNLISFSVTDTSGTIPFCISEAEGGTWVILLDSTLAGVKTTRTTASISEIFPNPTSRGASLTVNLETASKISAQVFDISGREERQLSQQRVGREGDNVLEIPTSSLSDGVYMVRTVFAGRIVTREMRVVR